MISSTLLNVDMEEKVFSSVIRWVKHDVAERKKHVSRVSLVARAKLDPVLLSLTGGITCRVMPVKVGCFTFHSDQGRDSNLVPHS